MRQRGLMSSKNFVNFLTIFLVFCLVFCAFSVPYQVAQAIVGVDDALIGILIAGLAAAGITFVSSGAYRTLTEYVGSLLDEYAVSMGFNTPQLFTGVQTGANTLGQILINNRMVQLISGFATWLKAKFTLANNQQYNVAVPETIINGLVTYDLPLGFQYQKLHYEYTRYYAENAYALIGTNNASNPTTFRFIFVSEIPNTVFRSTYNSDTHATTEQSYEMTYNNAYGCYAYETGLWNIASYADPNWVMYTTSEIKEVINAEWDVEVNDIAIDVNTGDITLPLDSPDYDDGDGAVIDVSAPWGMTYPDIVNKWLPKEWAPGMYGDPTITYDPPTTIDDQVVTGPDTAHVSSDPGEYAVPGLQSVFPFCIPFDIYNLLSALAADPVAPAFTWRFYVPGICDESITVDLTPFDTVAQVVRTIELLAFVVGLAMVTRERFLRG